MPLHKKVVRSKLKNNVFRENRIFSEKIFAIFQKISCAITFNEPIKHLEYPNYDTNLLETKQIRKKIKTNEEKNQTEPMQPKKLTPISFFSELTNFWSIKTKT